MAQYGFPSDSGALLASLQGQKIASVRRQVLQSDYDELPFDVRDEESDGPTELRFSDGRTLHFVPYTEQMSVHIGVGPMPSWGEHFIIIDPSANPFWTERIEHTVEHVHVLVSTYASSDNRSEFGVELELEGGRKVVLEYLSDEGHPDVLRVTGSHPPGDCRQLAIA
jgi:hypothetical protein